MKMRTSVTVILVLAAAVLSAFAQPAGHYQVSKNGRYLLGPDGRPFFWLGDTAWALCHVLDREEAAHYLDIRAQQGFTVIQLPAVMGRYIERANAYGDKPCVDKDLARPMVTPGNNPRNTAQYDYWDHVEYVVDAAAERGLTVAMLPFFVAFGPGWDYLSLDNAPVYGRFIGKRFGAKRNVIWVLGGDDRADTETKRAVWDAVAKGIAEGAVGSEDYSKLLMTYHSPGKTSSSFWLHNKPWLDFNMIQTWAAYTTIHERITHDYGLTPIKPTGLGEGAYENGPEYPSKPITAHVIRKEAYWSYLSGGYHTYGNTSVWNFGIESYYAKEPWQQALTDPGAMHVSVAARLFKSLPWWRLVPDQSVFAEGAGSGAALNVAARSDDGVWVVLYLAEAGQVRVHMSRLTGAPVHATWIDPRTGDRKPAGQYANTGDRSFSPPDSWEDAVLLLESGEDAQPADAASQTDPPAVVNKHRVVVQVADEPQPAPEDKYPSIRLTMPSIHDRQLDGPRQVPIQVEIPDFPHPFGVAPPPGVHPRVLVSPEDRERIARAWRETECGKAAREGLRRWIAGRLSPTNGGLYEAYRGLVAGDQQALRKAKSHWWEAQISATLCLESLVAWVENDQERGKNVAKALTTTAMVLRGKSIAIGKAGRNPDFEIGLAYDFAYNFMTKEQRDTVRSIIAESTLGRKSHGMGLPDIECTYNWMSHGMRLVLETLCIEGEKGYDNTILPKSVKVMRNLLTYGLYRSGVPHEAMFYWHFGMDTGALALVAFARRGHNLLGHPHYLWQPYWYLHAMEPFGYAFSRHHDTMDNDGGFLINWAILKNLLPNDPVMDFAWRNHLRDYKNAPWVKSNCFSAALFPKDYKPGKWDPAKLKQPRSWYCPDRGLLMTRSDWGREAMALHFECKMDEWTASHSHRDRNGFTLSSHGARWAVDRGYPYKETKDHSYVLIDGKGQPPESKGQFALGGTVLSYLDAQMATVITGEATAAYREYVVGAGFKHPYLPHFRKALRTALLVRGKHPYVLITDDIEQDGNTHLYEWLMQMPGTTEPVSIGKKEAIIRSTKNALDQSPRILVRALSVASSSGPFQVKDSGAKPMYHDRIKGKILSLSTRTVNPRFLILLFPHLPKEPLPKTTWKDERTRLAITWSDQSDEFSFVTGTDGQSGFVMTRGQDVLVHRVPRGEANGLSWKAAAAVRDFNAAWQNQTLTVSGLGWKSLNVRGRVIKRVDCDGSVGRISGSQTRHRLTEAAKPKSFFEASAVVAARKSSENAFPWSRHES